MKSVLKDIMDSLKKSIVENNCITSMAIPISETNIDTYQIEYSNDQERENYFYNLGIHCRLNDAFGVVLVLEGESVKPKGHHAIILQFIDFINEDFLTMTCQFYKHKFERTNTTTKMLEGVTDFVIEGYIDIEEKIKKAKKEDSAHIKENFDLGECVKCNSFDLCRKVNIDLLIEEVESGTTT